MRETKLHYKMYKKGKQWLYAAIAVTAFFGGVTISSNVKISADTSKQSVSAADVSSSSKAVVSNTSAKNSSSQQLIANQSNQSEKLNTQSASNDNMSSSAKQVSTASTTVEKKDNTAILANSSSEENAQVDSTSTSRAKTSSLFAASSSTNHSASDNTSNQSNTITIDSSASQGKTTDDGSTIPNISGGKYIDSNDTWTYLDNQGNKLKGLNKVDGNLQYFDETSGAQIKGEYEKIGDITYYFDKNSGNAVQYIATENGKTKAFQANGQPAGAGFFMDQNGDTYYFNIDGSYKIGLQEINGKTYYFDNNGKLVKDAAESINGKTYYSNAATGETEQLVSQSIPKQTSSAKEVADFAAHNVAYSYDTNSFENINGYLTADSWYRPKFILNDGQLWIKSNTTDFRPLLMAWWPSKSIEADYLNYMMNQGIIQNGRKFTAEDDSLVLNSAAQNVQSSLEKNLTMTASTVWLRQLMQNFVKTEAIWNKSSEDPRSDGLSSLQGGFLTYQNSKLTPNANSNYRILGYVPSYIKNGENKGSEFLLANDIDNSNPIVQAEELNWLYYLMNFGSITANNPAANFDGIRVDAVDNVDADLLNIAADYFKDAYNVNQNDQNANDHLSILEDWNTDDDPRYVYNQGANQLTMDDYVVNQMNYSLENAPGSNDKMARFLQWYLINRANDSTENTAIPNYTFVRAHDSNSQDQIRSAVQAATGGQYGVFTWQQLQQGLELYYSDQNSTYKKFNRYNIPSSYAMILTNKDTVPRIYYGDMYLEGGQYMANKTIYYNTIANLLTSRIKYVAGGQTMAVDNNDVLTSVRFGKDAMTAADQGTSVTRTEGIGVIISNNTNLSLKNSDQVILHMGAAHRNQAYRAAVLTTANGIVNYTSDENAPIAYTDNNGDLIFTNRDLVVNGVDEANTNIQGYANPEVTGYLAVWVPVGAAANQDARTAATTTASTDGKTLHSNAALDSNAIFEGFSNFISYPDSHSDNTNVIIAKNATLFKSLGFTSFELAPQYRTSGDKTFLDSTIDNGYAFTDRYDLGFGTPTKYGTVDDLRNAIESLHANGIQAIADWVPDQIYNLPTEELVTANRTDERGNQVANAKIHDMLYVANTIGGGDYQKKYGGAFLNILETKYPDLFSDIQASTGKPIDPSIKITSWSAKYFNGTNILGRGSEYVLRSLYNNAYFYVGTDSATASKFLPESLVAASDQKKYSVGDQSENGYYVQERIGNKWYLINPSNNQKQVGFQYIPDQEKTVFYNKQGQMQYGQQKVNGKWYLFDDVTGAMKVGMQYVANQHKTVYYNDQGQMQYGQQKINGKWYLFDAVTGARKNGFQYVANQHKTVYYNDQGQMQYGQQKINGKWYLFDAV
ncbi:MAG: glycoside hydrolase family 70 protein, partial [Liquorilactobacillus ghanensis]|uniref:glycoside hydrolase family 70 protein n=2 Tax=Liquorilactobacillus ghanensis TaxID=399370 RepID=UPI0039EB8E65